MAPITCCSRAGACGLVCYCVAMVNSRIWSTWVWSLWLIQTTQLEGQKQLSEQLSNSKRSNAGEQDSPQARQGGPSRAGDKQHRSGQQAVPHLLVAGAALDAMRL